MITKEIAAILALRVYEQGVSPENLPLDIDGWEKLPNPLSVTDGFAYGIFRNTATNEVVISYRGTDGVVGMMGADGANNLGLALGQGTSQAIQAAKLFVKVLELYGSDLNGSNISFTGHSLGGGLAGVMAVWFGRPAIVFDPAPFQLAAIAPGTVNDIINILGARAPLALRNFQLDILSTFAAREMAVDSHFAVGEFLAFTRGSVNTVYGTNTPYTFGNQNGEVSMFAMHSQALLVAGILSQNFREATVAVQASLPLIMSKSFYSQEPNGASSRNFLIDLIRSEQTTPANGKLTHFAADLNKLGTNIAGLNKAAQDALIAQGIEWYYWQSNNYAGQEFFTQTGELLQYTPNNADDTSTNKSANKAFQYVSTWLDPLVQASGGYNVTYNFEQWSVAAGTSGSTATARNADKTQIYIGGDGADTFTGGDKADMLLAGGGADTLNGGAGVDHLYGGAGDDILNGGLGGDWLYGGAGNDSYQLTSGELFDVISDSDGNGTITVDGTLLKGGKKAAEGYWISEDKKWGYSLTSGGDLIISKGSSPDTITIRNWQANGGDKLGITLEEGSPLVPANSLIGDKDEAGALDLITGTAADDHIQGLGGDDALLGRDGDDLVEGGEGNDVLMGGLGADTLKGGAGVDLIYGSSTGSLYSGGQPPEPLFPVQLGLGLNWRHESSGPDADGFEFGYLSSSISRDIQANDKGNIIDGGAGDDVIFAGTGSDVVHGGADKDQILGMAGSDVLFGDAGDDRIYGDGPSTDPTAGASVIYTPAEQHGADVIDGGDGNDILIGQGGNDAVYGGIGNDKLWGDDRDSVNTPVAVHGNDYLDGEEGDDTLLGEGGDDTLYGGAGNDLLLGDDDSVERLPGIEHGDDYLDGEDGNDTLLGDGGNDTLYGGAGNDILYGDDATLETSLHGDDYLDGEDGDDELTGNGGNDTLRGGAGDDRLFGNAGDDVADGGAGNDQIAGGEGNDTISGDAGNDTLLGDAGNDQLQGGDGMDHLQGDAGDDVLDGGADNDALLGEAGNDQLLGGAGVDELQGGDGDDVLDGGADNDTLFGQAGNDALSGGDGDDQLVGGSENDTIGGGAGNDAAWGDAGDDVLAGGDGNDTLAGGEGNDLLLGGEGNDTLFGQIGDDVLEGGAGDDVLIGGQGNDTLIGGTGFDQLYGGAGDDTYVFNLGDIAVGTGLAEFVDDVEGVNNIQLDGVSIDSMSLTPFDGLGSNVFMLETGQSTLLVRGLNTGAIGRVEVAGVSYSAAQFYGKTYAWETTETVATAGAVLQGGRQGDTLTGTGGNTTFSGGLGNDTLIGSGGNNVYRYDPGDGVDTISDTSAAIDAGGQAQTSTLVFGPGIVANQLVLSTDDGALVIGFGVGQAGALRLSGFTPNNALQPTRIDRFEFADGTVLTHAQLVGRGFDISGTTADETVSGTSLADRLTGGAGSDTLVGGGGADTYIFNIGDGSDVIADGDVLAGGNDTLRFGQGIAAADVFALRSGGDVTFVHGEDRMTLRSYFSGGAQAVERIEFADGTQWSQADVLAVVQASASHDWVFTGDVGNNTLYGLGGNDRLDGLGGNDILYGGSGNDTLIGGAGSNTLYGESGSDTYVIGLTISSDVIDESNGGDIDGIDTLQFVDGINRANVLLGASGNDLRLQGSLGDKWFDVTVNGQWASDSPVSQIERFVFADGTVMTAQDVKAELLKTSTLRDFIIGFDTADSVMGGWGGDTLYGRGGGDILHGDQSDDSLYGEAGADQLYGDTGNDALIGGDGDDTLDGGAGWDRLDGGAGNDTYVFGLGQGNDIIVADASGIDRVQLATGLTVANVTLHRVASPPAVDMAYRGDSLVIQLNGGADQLWIANYFETAAPGNVETLRFADGTSWDYAAITSRLSTQAGTANTLTGTNKANTFAVDHWNDVINDATLNDGDKVNASVSYRLPGTITDLTLTGTLNLFGVGSSSTDILRGNAGNNWFEFSMGMGSDTLAGGKGDDVYVVKGENEPVEPSISPAGMGGAVITELANEGIDTMISGFWSAQLSDNVENLVLGTPNTMAGSAFYYTPYSYNDYSHKLIGNTLNNVLDASIYEDMAVQQSWFHYRTYNGFQSLTDFRLDGGAGADTLIGGRWNDTYVIDNAGDVVIELGTTKDGRDQSNDTVETSLETSLLTQFPNIENITLLGSTNVNATGNVINNRLDGSRNTAANRLTGGVGDDTYVVGTGDSVVELIGEGIDTVVVASASSSTVLLADYTNVENIRLQRDVGDLNVVGDALANEITGSLGNNQLSGGGGNDTITDQFLGDTAVYVYDNTAADNDLLEGGNGDDNLLSRGGLDTFDGGAGDDALRLYYASRTVTVRLGLGDGHDHLYQDAGATVNLSLELKTGIGLGDVVLQRSSDLTTVTLVDGTSVDLNGNVNLSLSFADGTLLGQPQIEAMLRSTDRNTTTELDDLLFGTSSADTIAVLGGNDSVYAGNGADLLDGGLGHDMLFGGAGADILIGGAGNDTLAGGTGADLYSFSRGFGQDVIDDSLLGGSTHGTDDGAVDIVEFDATVAPTDVLVYRQVSGSTPSALVLALSATGDAVTIQNAYATGGVGAVELVRFANGTQWDLPTLKTRISGEVGYDTDDTLSAPVVGSRLEGRGGNDTLKGSTGADILDGGTGNDSMSGLAGDDTYLVDSLWDAVVEVARGGTDTVIVSVDNHVLATEVERLQMAVGTQPLRATGNTLNNSMTGNAGANRLDGGTGSDTLIGGAGDDVYVVNSTGDVVTELAGEGTDAVESSITYTLGANVEKLTLTGTGNINGTGNTLNNVLTGNSGSNTLTGTAGNDTLDGGLGTDILVGGAGNDTYVLGRGYGADTVTENDTTSGINDTLQFLSGIATDQLWLRKVSNNLEVSIIGTSDKMTLSNWYLGSQYHTEQFKTSDGKTLLDSQVQNLVSAMAAFAPPAAGQTTLAANYATTLNPVIAANWQ